MQQCHQVELHLHDTFSNVRFLLVSRMLLPTLSWRRCQLRFWSRCCKGLLASSCYQVKQGGNGVCRVI